MSRLGLNLIADLRVNTGIGECNRNLVDAILAHGIDTSLIELVIPHRPYLLNLPERYQSLPTTPQHDINLLAYEPSILPHVSMQDLRALILKRYTIGFWFFELPHAPVWWQNGLGYADEIWTISNYAAQVFHTSVQTPTFVVPSVVKVGPPTQFTRSDLGLPTDRFIFYFSFDCKSSFARKNPWAVIEAFTRAFIQQPSTAPVRQQPILVIKARDLHQFPQAQHNLKAALANIGGILLDADYPRPKVDTLLQHCDCYVSLHSAEGFGMGMAEAMSLGKPVIATNFSANTDYLNASNGYPVNYTPHEITAADHVYDPGQIGTYEPGQVWAAPDIIHAAALMREVYCNPAEATRRRAQAAIDIQQHCSAAAVGKLVAARLQHIANTTLTNETTQITKRQIFAKIAVGNYRMHYERWLKIHHMIETLPYENHRYLGRWMRTPLISFLAHYAKRLRWLGHLTYAQHDVNAAALDVAECLAGGAEN